MKEGRGRGPDEGNQGKGPEKDRRGRPGHLGLKVEVRPVKKPAVIEPDRFQVQALEAACRGENVLVVAPTGAGKTWVAEQLAARVLDRGEGLMFASPIKALSNQKYREFARLFGEDNVGLITGDVSINSGAPVIILTTEILRNKCMSKTEDLGLVRWIVLDEFHLMDSDRGAAWEDTIIFAPLHVVIVCLSATVPNYREIAGWIQEVRQRPVSMVVEKSRPVPLSWRWFVGNQALAEKEARQALGKLKQRREDRPWSYGRYTYREPYHYQG